MLHREPNKTRSGTHSIDVLYSSGRATTPPSLALQGKEEVGDFSDGLKKIHVQYQNFHVAKPMYKFLCA